MSQLPPHQQWYADQYISQLEVVNIFDSTDRKIIGYIKDNEELVDKTLYDCNKALRQFNYFVMVRGIKCNQTVDDYVEIAWNYAEKNNA